MEEAIKVENLKKHPGSILKTSKKGNKLFFYGAEETLEISVLSDHVMRVRFAADGFFERDFSYAIRPDFKAKKTDFQFKESAESFNIKTGNIQCVIGKTKPKIDFLTASGSPILEDDTGFHWESNTLLNGNYIYCSKKIQEEEYYFGLGDKPTELNLRGKRLQNWASDKYGFEKDTDPIYRDIPFYLGMHHGMAYGVFFDNSYRKFFDFGFEDKTVASFWADGGQMCYYVIFGPELVKVVERYAWLTGTHELPPLWTLGYHQSKWSYFPESKVMEVANEFRSRKIPCDSIHLDIDYMDGFRCFTWNNERFPDPKAMVEKLKTMGIKPIPIIDPGIKVDEDYQVYQQGFENNHFCRRSEGGMMSGDVWPGKCLFPDFTKPETRKWWGTLFKDLTDIGIQGVWNDMNEPTVFGQVTFPDDVRHDHDGDNASHRKVHNVYGMQMARATQEGLKKLSPQKRPFCLTRAGFSGVQRYSAIWTGDNIGNWEHLWLANIQCQRLSMSGVSFVGSDIGGFIGEPDGNLLARWIQLGVFHPFFRGHSSGDRGDKEPWVFGEAVEKIVRKYIELRYKLLPYIYTTFWQHSHFGTPIVRPLSFLDQNDPETHYRMDEFGFGDSLLICPVSQPHEEGRWMYLPKGGWFNYWEESYYEGGIQIWVDSPLDTLPLFVKAGAVLPQYPVQQYVGEKKIEAVNLHIYHVDGKVESVLYEDAGDGYAHQNGEKNVIKFAVEGNAKSLRIQKTVEHSGYKSSHKKYEVYLHGLPFNPFKSEADGQKVELKYTKRSYVFHFTLQKDFKEILIS
jgi:alpha-glucosidase